MTPPTATAPPLAAPPVLRTPRALDAPAPVFALSLLALTAVTVDAVTGEARLVLGSLVLLGLALAVTMAQSLAAGAGRPERTSRLAARAAVGASLFVAAFLALVGVLERTAADVVESTAVAAGVALMSVLLLVVLPLALAVLGWCVWQDRRLTRSARVLPGTLLLVVLTAVAASLATDGTQERWLQAVAVAAAGAVLTGFSGGLPRVGSAPHRRHQR